MLIDIEVIIFMKIIPNIDIRIAVQIDICHANAQSIADDGTINTGFFCDISKFIVAIVSEKPIAGKRIYSARLSTLGPKVPF